MVKRPVTEDLSRRGGKVKEVLHRRGEGHRDRHPAQALPDPPTYSTGGVRSISGILGRRS
ncbi:MAG: hypothetical protein IPG75_15520 [Gemmatimonadetes bacterium]|nr:hypothetical protein [Gemmatimonadota bacterium]